MTESRFNNCFILHVHKELAECINLEDVAKEMNAFTTVVHTLIMNIIIFIGRCRPKYRTLRRVSHPF